MGVTQQSGDEPDDDGSNAVEQSVVDDLMDRMERVEDRQERLERENDDLRDRVEEVENENDDLRRSLSEARGIINSVRERVGDSLGDDLRERIADLDERVDRVRDAAKHSLSKIEKLEKRVDSDGDLHQEARDAVEADPSVSITPETRLETVVALPDRIAEEQLTENQERARWVASVASEQSTVGPDGETILTSEQIRKALRLAERDTRQVSRIVEFLDEFGESAVSKRKNRGRWVVVFHGDAVGRLDALAEADVHGVVNAGS